MLDLKATAKTKGLRQKDVADRLGVSEPTISKWFQRRADIPTQFIGRLAEVLEVEPSQVLEVALALPTPVRDLAAA